MLVVVLSLLACHSLAAPTFVPFTYVSPAPVYGPAYATNYFKASLCSQSAYDGMLITVDLNLPYTPWSMSAGSVLGVQVATDAQLTNIITNNTVNGQLLPTWSFPYSLSYGDLYFRVSNGASPNIVYTVSLVFTSQKLGIPVISAITPSLSPSKSEYTFVDLQQLISIPQAFQTQTGGDPWVGAFSYCPTSTNYDLIIQAEGADGISAVALYVCINPSEFPCSAGTAQQAFSNPIGSFVASVSLSTNTGQFTVMQVAVYGWGEYQKQNTFMLTVASPPCF
jgi:hypothetical protein